MSIEEAEVGTEKVGTDPPAEVQAAYDELLLAFAGFMQATSAANELGIDVAAALGQSLRGSMSSDELEGIPVYLRMALGL